MERIETRWSAEKWWASDERDACGTGFVAHRHGLRSHQILRQGLRALENLEHRGAVSTDGKSSDGAGILTEIPFALICGDLGIDPPADTDTSRLAVAMVFLPADADARVRCEAFFAEELEAEGLRLRGWRDVPFDADALGDQARRTAPVVRQAVVADDSDDDLATLRRRLYLIRRRVEKRAAQAGFDDFAVPSFSDRTIVYKGLVLPANLAVLYPDLAEPSFTTSVALFHQRYSTNTMPTWRLAQPLRFIAHNGEINTLLGNVNRMRAREPEADVSVWGETVYDLVPVISEGASDSMALDNTLELLIRSGRSLPHAMAMLVPEAHEARPDMSPELRAFFRYHEAVMEPWDGPAALVFTDGEIAGASLDRNGLRPLRYWLAADGLVVVGSEAGIVDIPEDDIVEKGRLGPGQMLAVDLRTGEFHRDAEIKGELATRKPWKAWIDAHGEQAGEATPRFEPMRGEALMRHQKFFGYGSEHLDRVLEPMYRAAREPIGSMGDDTPLAVLSEMPQRLYRYFKQRFAQVTNPPIDPLRERLVMSLTTKMGLAGALLREDEEPARFIEFPSPIITSEQLAWLEGLDRPRVQSARLSTVFDAAAGPPGLAPALQALCDEAEAKVREGTRVLILSDRDADETWAPIPTLLATAAVHHRLIRAGLRMRTALVCDGGDIIEDHDFACLLGYGAMLIHPYVAYDSVAELAARDEEVDVEQALANYRATVEKGLLKIMAKMGISAVSSYRSAQIFEILGLAREVVDDYFTGTPSRIGGANLELLAGNTLAFHAEACGSDAPLHELGLYRFRRNGEYHAFNPLVFTNLHKAVRNQDFETFRKYASQVDDRPPMTLRDLLSWRKADDPVPLDEVEPAEEIVRRFSTQAMSFGSLSRETHELLGVAMNRIGAKSNSGEGGEEGDRFEVYDRDRPDRSVAKWHPKQGDWGSSYIKQVASGRFGVTPYYLASARELEIKMAQGSKPGEGGHIPGFKVTEEIAATRRSQPGVTLISPPPHHDIYSIEDLAQLIYDLKRVNAEATVCVKLVSVVGVGTIAAGVAKGYADTIQISGHDGGTGASPLGSIKHAGLPWELGLAEIQQTLVRNGLRGRVKLRVDGGLKTGRDVIIGALLGGEEFGFGTAALVAAGCVMARKCHSNTCPVGIATQRDDLRARFPGTPEHVVSFMFFVAEHVRLIMAEMGIRRLDDLIGRTDLLVRKVPQTSRGESVDTSALLALADTAATGKVALRRKQPRNDRPGEAPLDQTIADDVLGALEQLEPGESLSLSYAIDNRERSIGARLSGLIARTHHDEGLPEGTVEIRLRGQAGQSFGVFAHRGLRLILDGEAQDYVGKGLGGAELIIRPPKESKLAPQDHVILGNTALYGATAGRLFAAGRAGERLAVRNSGAVAVVEGCGDHGCEYMTGGIVVVLGPTGLNFGAGMSGGVAYVWDPEEVLPQRYNPKMAQLVRVSQEDDAELRALVEAHLERTCSRRAHHLVERWESARGEFWKVVPRRGE